MTIQIINNYNPHSHYICDEEQVLGAGGTLEEAIQKVARKLEMTTHAYCCWHGGDAINWVREQIDNSESGEHSDIQVVEIGD